jgi:hypothetical protein
VWTIEYTFAPRRCSCCSLQIQHSLVIPKTCCSTSPLLPSYNLLQTPPSAKPKTHCGHHPFCDHDIILTSLLLSPLHPHMPPKHYPTPTPTQKPHIATYVSTLTLSTHRTFTPWHYHPFYNSEIIIIISILDYSLKLDANQHLQSRDSENAGPRKPSFALPCRIGSLTQHAPEKWAK